ncbi:hypothetical protein [Aquimarina sp. AU474]|uniref:hypothetical protein n=1 Tax=Aquimarina sp. AU474 TaxID=2108529 RepID=UPI000D691399|nr:hypothetical protein [Aquimarina sp. AU474]
MKKISILITVFAILCSYHNTTAQESNSTEKKTEEAITQNGYQKIELSKVSEIIRAAVEKDYPGASITEAYIDTHKNYKLILAINNETKTVYTNARGEWFDPSKEG